MSPGGFCSVGTGDSVAGALGDPPLEPVGLDPPLDGVDPPPHAESRIAATRAIGAMDRTGLGMGSSFGTAVHPLYAREREGSVRMQGIARTLIDLSREDGTLLPGDEGHADPAGRGREEDGPGDPARTRAGGL